MPKDQNDKVTSFDPKNSISYDELQTILNELMDNFHKVLKNYFFISNEKVDLVKELLEKENKSLNLELAPLKGKNYKMSKDLIVLK